MPSSSTAPATVPRAKPSNLVRWRTIMSLFVAFVAHQLVSIKSEFDEINQELSHPVSFFVEEFGSQLALALAFTLVHYVVKKILLPLADKLVKHKQSWSDEVRHARKERWCASVFKLVYFICITIFGWHCLKDMDWMPAEMAGSGSLDKLATPGSVPVPQAAHTYYTIASAYHLSETIFQLAFEFHRPDFYEMIMHHCATNWLLAFSLIAGYHRHGTLVLFLHDASDIPAYLTKLTVDTTADVSCAIAFANVLLSWGYLRLYVFPLIIYRSIYICSPQTHPGYHMFIGMKLALVGLHLYWYRLFLHMGYRFLATGQQEDKQANLAAMEKDR